MLETIELGRLENLDDLIEKLDDLGGKAHNARYADYMIRFEYRNARCWVNVLNTPSTHGVEYRAGWVTLKDFQETDASLATPFGVLAVFAELPKPVKKMPFVELLKELQTKSVLARMTVAKRNDWQDAPIILMPGVVVTVTVAADRQIDYLLRDVEKPNSGGWIRDPFILIKILWERYYMEDTE